MDNSWITMDDSRSTSIAATAIPVVAFVATFHSSLSFVILMLP
jgi:hypothetical protein